MPRLDSCHWWSWIGWQKDRVEAGWLSPGRRATCHRHSISRPLVTRPGRDARRPRRHDWRADRGMWPRTRGPARDALIAGGAFLLWDGLLPANRLAHTYRVRLRHTLRRGHTVEGPYHHRRHPRAGGGRASPYRLHRRGGQVLGVHALPQRRSDSSGGLRRRASVRHPAHAGRRPRVTSDHDRVTGSELTGK